MSELIVSENDNLEVELAFILVRELFKENLITKDEYERIRNKRKEILQQR